MALKHSPYGTAGPATERGDIGAILAWFGRRQAIPLVAPPRFREYGPLSDDPDYPDAKFNIRYIAGATFGIEYLDQRGWLSTRTIRCIALASGRPALLQAYCNVRKTERTFRLDRVVSTTNLRTGVTAQSGGLRVLFAPAFLPEDPACDAFVTLLEATRPGVYALMALSMADGWLSADARDVVVTHMVAEAKHRGLALPPIDLLTLWVENLSPSKEAVLQEVTRLLGDVDAVARLLPHILEISRTFCSAAQDNEGFVDLIKVMRTYFHPRPAARTMDFIAWR